MFSPEDHTEQAFNNVRDAVRTPLYGCDCYAYGLLAAGCVDLVVEADLKPYDYMALVTVVQEAGGVMTDWLVSWLVILLMAQLLNESLASAHTTWFLWSTSSCCAKLLTLQPLQCCTSVVLC